MASKYEIYTEYTDKLMKEWVPRMIECKACPVALIGLVVNEDGINHTVMATTNDAFRPDVQVAILRDIAARIAIEHNVR